MNLNKVVVATDLSEGSLAAVETALNLTLESNATLYLVHVMDFILEATIPMVGVAGPSLETLSHEHKLRLQALVPRNHSGKFKIETEVLVGSAAAEIANFAREKKADLIVVGTHGRKGLTRILLGSTAEALLRHAPCQVLVVKPKTSAHVPDTIVAPTKTGAT